MACSLKSSSLAQGSAVRSTRSRVLVASVRAESKKLKIGINGGCPPATAHYLPPLTRETVPLQPSSLLRHLCFAPTLSR